MDHLPPHLILEILSRLTDSVDIARCRLVSRTLNAVSRDVRSISFFCTLPRYLKSRSPETRSEVAPFKAVFNGLVARSRVLESVAIGVEKLISGAAVDDVDDESDLYLTDVEFVKEWLPRICEDLRCLAISDFWFQSCWRRSDVLALISSCCHGLVKLEVKNAWLSIDNLKPMLMLTSLTLEFIRLDDEDLINVNHCFPCLQVLNLMGVGGLKEPKIHLFHLRTCQWTVSNAPQSLSICAPNLVKLKLNCIKPRSLLLETPSLFDLYLSIEEVLMFEVKGFPNLKNLQLHSANLCKLVHSFPSIVATKRLTVGSMKSTGPVEKTTLCLAGLFNAFQNINFLTLHSGAWIQMEACFLAGGLQGHIGMKGLKEITAQLVIDDIDVTLSFIFCILDTCTNLSDMTLLIHQDVYPNVGSILISRCTAHCPRVRWRWGMWKEDTKDH